MSVATTEVSRVNSQGSKHRIRKRTGTIVDYKRQKIEQAVKLCLVNGCCREDNEDTAALVIRVTDQVERILKGVDGPIAVETIQDLIEQSLYAVGEPEVGRQYIIYREEHRKLREETAIDPKLQAVFAKGTSYFTGANHELQIVQSLDKFSRFREDLGGRREVWPETVERVMDFYFDEMVTRRGASIPAEKWEWLRKGLLAQKATPSMRAIQLAGPALTRCNTGINNCSWLFMDSPESLAEDLYLLMQGCGVGYSVEREAIDKWPRVQRQRNAAADSFVVPDTTEGWCDALKLGLNTWLSGGDVKYDFSQVRPEGAPLKTKGGTCSGSGPLVELLSFARNRILSRQGGCLSSLDVHDITCFAHRIVQMGGVRRASGISLSDLSDFAMRDCKAGVFWETAPQRNQANNSAAYNQKPTMAEFIAEWTALVSGGTGERGIFGREAAIRTMPERRRSQLSAEELSRVGCNPSLRSGTKVLTASGVFSIEKLVGSEISVPNLDGELSPATCFISGRNKPLWRVELSGGHTYYATAEHRWPVYQPDGTTSKKYTKDLSANDRLPVVRRHSLEFGSVGDHSEGFLVGCLLGDGHFTPRKDNERLQVGLTLGEDKFKIFGALLESVIARHGADAKFSRRDRDGGISYELNTTAIGLISWLGDLGCSDKLLLPAAVWTVGSEAFRRGLIDGLFSTDGSIDTTKSPGRVAPLLYSACRTLIDDVSALLGFYGIQSNITTTVRSSVQFPNGKDYDRDYTLHKLSIIRMDDVIHFRDVFTLTHTDKQAKLNNAPSRRVFSQRLQGIAVSAVTLTDMTEDVYDITVFDDTHCFTLSHCVTGNCGEIVNINQSFCNLSLAVTRPHDTISELEEKVAAASAWGTMQSAMTRYNYIRDAWRSNVEKERLLGVDLLGHLDHDLLGGRVYSEEKAATLRHLKACAINSNVEWAKLLGINPSVAVTCNKPSGDCSVLFDTSAGFKAHHGQHFLRRLRFKPNNPVACVLKDSGVPCHVDYDSSGLLVFEFPCVAPVDNPILLGEQSAIEQLENWKIWKLNWTEHSPSVTVYVRESEWLAVGDWVWKNWDIVTGLSFFPFSDAHYRLAPYETIDEAEYTQRKSVMPVIDWSKLCRYEIHDMTELKQQMACTADGCAML